MGDWVRIAVVLFIAAVAIACGSLIPAPDASPAIGESIDVVNNTTLAITIVVNGAPVRTIDPGGADAIPERLLPPKPWHVAAMSPSGRELLQFDVEPGVVFVTTNPDGSTTINGVGRRIDGPCGRLDVAVGAPMHGPAPPPASGSCEP